MSQAARTLLVVCLLVVCLLAGVFAPSGSPARAQTPQEMPQYPIAVLQGLDKITARISTFEAAIDEPVAFGSLEITVRSCHKRPPTEPPESAAFLEIVERRPDEPPVRLFTGWMFASSPALSAMEHPVYDVWVLDCKDREPAEPTVTEPEAESTPVPMPRRKPEPSATAQ